MEHSCIGDAMTYIYVRARAQETPSCVIGMVGDGPRSRLRLSVTSSDVVTGRGQHSFSASLPDLCICQTRISTPNFLWLCRYIDGFIIDMESRKMQMMGVPKDCAGGGPSHTFADELGGTVDMACFGGLTRHVDEPSNSNETWSHAHRNVAIL